MLKHCFGGVGVGVDLLFADFHFLLVGSFNLPATKSEGGVFVFLSSTDNMCRSATYAKKAA